MAKATANGVTPEAELYAPDLDEGEVDVERYLLPDESGVSDPYLKRVWALARESFPDGTLAPEESSKD